MDAFEFWYPVGMKNHYSDSRRSSDPVTKMAATVAEVTAERARVNKDLLQELALAVAANERAHGDSGLLF